jgi:hypothetical protein
MGMGGAAAAVFVAGCTGGPRPVPPSADLAPTTTPHDEKSANAALRKPEPRRLGLPARAPGAKGARAFIDHVAGLGAGERERRVESELVLGNVPEFVRKLVPVRLDPKKTGARDAFAFVTPDYLCLGSDDDFVRMGTTMHTVRKVCAAARAIPPTRQLVDAIYAVAPFKITSPLMSAGAGRPEDILAHHDIIERRWRSAGGKRGELVAGCKKDIVISKRMLETPGRTAIYGWMLADGSVVQSLSLIHDERFLDYVQGVRLVDRKLWIDGRDVDVLDVLADEKLAPLLSDEGRFDMRIHWERGY